MLLFSSDYINLNKKEPCQTEEIIYNFILIKSGRSSGVEHQLPKLGVAGSNPVARSYFIFRDKMIEKDIKERIRELIETPILKRGLELVDLEWKKERTGWVLRLFIDKPGGVTIGDCAKISEMVGKILDKEDLIHRSYNLEVSSPGIERPLVKKEDFERFRGEKAKVVLKSPLEGRKNFSGIILGIEEEFLLLEIDQKVWRLPLGEIKKANLQPELKF